MRQISLAMPASFTVRRGISLHLDATRARRLHPGLRPRRSPCLPFPGTARARPSQPLFLVYCSVEKLMHQRTDPIHFFFQREMARVEKMELCTGNIFLKEFRTLHRKDSVVLAPSDQHGRLLLAEILLPFAEDIQIPLCVVEDCE